MKEEIELGNVSINMDVNKILEDIAQGLGVAVEKIYPVLYKQAYIDGVMYILGLLLIIASIVALIIVTKKVLKVVREDMREFNDSHIYHKKDLGDYPGHLAPLIIWGVLNIFGLFFGIALIRDILIVFFNTDYYIVTEVLKKLGGL